MFLSLVNQDAISASELNRKLGRVRNPAPCANSRIAPESLRLKLFRDVGLYRFMAEINGVPWVLVVSRNLSDERMDIRVKSARVTVNENE